MLIAGSITLAVCYFGARSFDRFMTLRPVIFELVKICSIFALCLIIYIPLNLLFKMDYANELVDRIKNKFAK